MTYFVIPFGQETVFYQFEISPENNIAQKVCCSQTLLYFTLMIQKSFSNH